MAVRFDGTTESLRRTTNFPTWSSFTVCFWLQITSDINDYNNLFYWGDNGFNDGFWIGTDSDGTTLRIDNWPSGARNYSALTVGTWYHIAVVNSGTTITPYIDGAAQTTITSSQAPSNTQWGFGGVDTSGTPISNSRMFAGKVFSRALSAADVLQEMRAIRVISPVSLHGHYPMFPGSGERGRDYSGNGYDLTENGTLSDEDPPPVSYGAGITWASFASALNAYTLTAAQASFTLTGNATGLRAARLLTATQQTYTLTGQAAALKFGRLLTAAQQSYTLSGQDAILAAQRKLTAVQQSYALAGQAAGLIAARVLTAAQQTYALTGQAAILRAARLVSATQQTYTLTGYAASLIYTPLGGYTLVADYAAWVLTGQAAGLYRGRLLTAAQQTYTLAGQDAALRAARLLALTQASYALTGSAAGLYRGRLIVAGPGAYALTGEPAIITAQRLIVAAIVAYLLTGQAAALNYSNAPQPTYGSVSGQAVSRLRARIAARLRGQNVDRTR